MTCPKCRVTMKEVKGHVFHKQRKWDARSARGCGSRSRRGSAKTHGYLAQAWKTRPKGLPYSPKQRMLGPAATATYWRPSSRNVIGPAFIRTLVGKLQSSFPSRASTAANPPFGLP